MSDTSSKSTLTDTEDSMPSKRLVPEQRVFEVEEQLVRLAAAKDEEIAQLKNEIENLQSDADNDGAYITAMKLAQTQICEAIGVERGTDNWPEFMERVQLRIATLTEQRDRGMAILRKVKRILIEDTNAEDDPCCGWGPLLAEVRAALDTQSSPSLPEGPIDG